MKKSTYTIEELESMMNANLGDLVLRHSEVTSLPDNLTVEGDLDLRDTPITSLPDNLTVDGTLYLYNTPITSLPDNLTVGGDLWLDGTPITSLPDNLRVHGSIHLERTQITSLPVNFSVGRDLVLNDTPITSLPDYLTVGRGLELENTQITSLPEHLAVGGRLNLYGTKITSLPKNLEGEPVVITPDNRLVPWYSFKKYKKITSDDVKAYLDKQPWEVHEEYDTTYLDFTYRDGIECSFTKSFAAPERFTRGTEAFTEAAMEHYGYTQDEWYALDDAKFLDLERDYETGACADEFLDWAYELLDSDDYEEACEELADEANAWYAENEITPDE